MIFLSILKKPYLDHMIGQVTANFATFIMVREKVEDGLKGGKLIYIEALQTMLKKELGNSQKATNGKRKEGIVEGKVNILAM